MNDKATFPSRKNTGFAAGRAGFTPGSAIYLLFELINCFALIIYKVNKTIPTQ